MTRLPSGLGGSQSPPKATPSPLTLARAEAIAEILRHLTQPHSTETLYQRLFKKRFGCARSQFYAALDGGASLGWFTLSGRSGEVTAEASNRHAENEPQQPPDGRPELLDDSEGVKP